MIEVPSELRIPDRYSLLGITGNAASGKDYVAEMISKNGYIHVSSGDILREEIINRGQTPNREIQTLVANELRDAYGADVLVKSALKRAIRTSEDGVYKGAVISGLYAPGEASAIKNLGGHIIEIVSGTEDDLGARYRRLKTRQDGSRDMMDYDAFVAAFFRENSGVKPHQANISDVARLADFRIVNDGSSEQLEKQINNILKGQE